MYIDSLTLGSMARFLYVMIPVSVRTSFRNVFEEGAKYLVFGGDLKGWCAVNVLPHKNEYRYMIVFFLYTSFP